MSKLRIALKPILFSGAMVRAILSGAKSQTRRVMKPQPRFVQSLTDGRFETSPDGGFDQGVKELRCPYGAPGDLLWLRETFWFSSYSSPHPKPSREAIGEGWGVSYKATEPIETSLFPPIPKSEERLRPSIFMPRWVSRITLQVESVRVERVAEISEADAIAEGCTEETHDGYRSARVQYMSLWDSLNAKRGHPWASSPWVWVISFKRVEATA